MKALNSLLLISFITILISCKDNEVSKSFEYFFDGSKEISSGDSILFERGKRYFVSLDLTDKEYDNIYIGAYGDTLLPNPILDGSLFRFDFDALKWDDFEVINGVKFYRKRIAGLELVENVYADDDMLTLAREPDADEELVTGQKNSFKGYFKIDSVDVKDPRGRFFDFSNGTDWGQGAEIVTKTQHWSYEVRKFSNDSSDFYFKDRFQDPLKKDWGYFVQRSYEALDRNWEWFYDEKEGVLYFSPLNNSCTVYISSNKNDNNAGIGLNGGKDITIEGLKFVNYKFGIKSESTENLTVKNCEIENCTYGIFSKEDQSINCIIENNRIKNMRSFGIKLFGDNTVIDNNILYNIGMTLGAESRGYNNLCGIDIRGKDNVISNNSISKTGYSGIRFFGSGGCSVINNTLDSTVQVMADGGALYTWHYIEGERNKLIRGNTITNAYGNADGTPGKYFHSGGIYLDELSLNFRVDSNYVSNCGGGIYIQNSRSDTVMYNTTENNNISEFHINHAGTILNGGKLNPDNDPNFDPNKLDSIPEGYVWDRTKGLLYYKNMRNGVVYVEQGNNLVKDNVFIPSKEKNTYSFQFRWWKNLNDDIIAVLSGNDNFFYNNIPDSLVKNAALFLQASNVRDMNFGSKDYMVVENSFDKTTYGYLRRIYIWIGRGVKNSTEAVIDRIAQ
ncbi:MAG: right-handed parallel beta-helix repeat-containing protein [Candidatus Delongbacteria bacterium]|nr:right-handed parallel beta-helix repeat-containing protein [Candidatus Delongbacteria bacterium]